MKYLLYNSKSNNTTAEAKVLEYASTRNDYEVVKDVVGMDYLTFFKALKDEDEVTIAGGDGTINYLINELGDYKIKNNLYLYPCGTGNDFYHDIVGEEYKENILLNPYLENLPVVEVKCNDSDTIIKKKFINGIGYGIDGYCCEVGDKLRKTTTKPINYTSIAIKGLLFHFKPVKAKVTVDGKVSEMKHVWLAPTMKGRFYGGGMKVAPNQDRFSGLVTTVTYKTFSKLKALIVFPSIFKGEHLKYKKIVSVYEGKEAEVVFNRPTALQIDGETISNVISYKVHA